MDFVFIEYGFHFLVTVSTLFSESVIAVYCMFFLSAQLVCSQELVLAKGVCWSWEYFLSGSAGMFTVNASWD